MKVISISLMFLISIYYLSCDNSVGDTARINNLIFPDSEQPVFDSSSVILENGTKLDDKRIDPYSVKDIFISYDSLVIKVTHGGGCEIHEFRLIAWNYFLESYPVQASLLLSHNSCNDFCEALITKRLSFDLSPLKKEYYKFYNSSSGIIKLNILIYQKEIKKIEYKF